MYSFSSSGWYWVRMPTVSIPELTQLERGKSIIRYFPPKGTAGFAVFSVKYFQTAALPTGQQHGDTTFFLKNHKERASFFLCISAVL